MAAVKGSKSTENPDAVVTPLTSWQRLSLFLTELGAVSKNQKNDHFRSKYADINAVIVEINETMKSHDILVTQEIVTSPTNDNGDTRLSGYNFGFLILTRVIDTLSGHNLLCSNYPIVCKDYGDPQKVGGAVTYARRYSLLTTLMLQAEDDDGNAAAKPTTGVQAKSKNDLVAEVQKTYDITSPDKLLELTTLVLGEEKATNTFGSLGMVDLNKILKYNKNSDTTPSF